MRLRVKIPLICAGVLAALVAAAAIWIAIVSRDSPPQDFSDLAYPYQDIPTNANAHAWFKAAGEAVVWGDHEQQIYQNFRHGTVDVVAVEAVPLDPFDGQPLRYSKERRIIWSVGENLRDDGGSKMDTRGGGGEAQSWRCMLDYVTDLPVPSGG